VVPAPIFVFMAAQLNQIPFAPGESSKLSP
jgi:hypothetical protein